MPTLSTKITQAQRDKLSEIAEKYNVSVKDLIVDMIDNFLSFNNVPYAFILKSGILNIINKGVPVRSILPFTTAFMGYNLRDEFNVRIDGAEYKIDPYPTYSLLCGIKMTERLYMLLKQVTTME